MDLRILQVMAGAEQGGAELFFERLCIGLHRAGAHQHILTRPASGRIDRLQEAGLRPVLLPFGGRLDLKTMVRMRQEITRFKPAVALAWMNRGARFTPTGSHVLCARLGGFYDIKYYRHCDWLVCLTEDIREHVVASGFPRERTVHLPNFVPLDRGEPAARKTLYTPDNVPLIFALGRLHENKAFDTLLRALAQVPDAYLWLAGDGPLRADLEALARELGIKPRVRFLGWRDDTAALYAAADLVVFPSRHEPHGNVVLEAWAQARPLICTATHGPASLITHGEDGLLVPVDDPRALAQTIRQTLESPALQEALARGGWESYQARFTEEKVVGAYRAFFEQVVAQRAAERTGAAHPPAPAA
ncbi:glycosyltransferase [Pararhodospirillum oryzae]|uniref:Glycosyl transferase n=1 Tax=Pararhodospirillum oryzae TaxID=478448 RepID=A0A512H903_9PROT|nr:glycosyltransferase [Pararhodospirillum oryzae]GEO81934.1 glycosyl transferase [Pararhodospirillum oryzae]